MALSDHSGDPFMIDMGTRRFGYRIGAADAVVRGSAYDMIMVAARRRPWRDALADGAIVIDGEDAVARALLEVLVAV
jgi:hypothetical protein